MYLALLIGGLSTLYPFLVMVSTAMKSQVDFNDNPLTTVIPTYFYDETALFRKYVEDRYANNLDDINGAYGADFARPADVVPAKEAVTPGTQKLAAHWEAFQKQLPMTYKKAGFGEHDNAPSRLLLRYREYLREKFKGDINALNKAWTEENTSFDTVVPPFERTALRDWTPNTTDPKVADWEAFKKTLPPHFLVTVRVDPLFRKFLREDRYEDDLARLNSAWGTQFADWTEITFPGFPPTMTAEALADWTEFGDRKFPTRMLSQNDDGLIYDSAENLWRLALQREYKTVEAANTEFGTNWRTFNEVQPPQAIVDWNYVRENAGALRSEFATRNFRTVAGYILLHGRAVFNTLVFCALAILTAIIVNPMCAYALSRYNLPYAYQVLIFVLATMAFPAEVAMIPNFLLLRDLGMLNTFWALVLPGIANGFSIFLLKGFFDSLPKELYEAGILDGASELTMFRRITMPLSLPIFSVIALNAFTGAYGAFLFAMVVCQDPKMWTLMVWLYDLQARAPQYVIFAALTLAAIPTLLVFLAAQKVILRGIILPSFK
ncbi:MAG: hypothetical protein OHK0029_39390 [Armatimonadaceae bacterium]